jgi:L-aminoadipate-semialdehyde dehydrogenase
VKVILKLFVCVFEVDYCCLGDVLAKRDVIRLQQLAPNCDVINMMGSTETQRSVSYLRILSGAMLNNEKEIIAAGVGMKDVQLLVLNKTMQR